MLGEMVIRTQGLVWGKVGEMPAHDPLEPSQHMRVCHGITFRDGLQQDHTRSAHGRTVPGRRRRTLLRGGWRW